MVEIVKNVLLICTKPDVLGLLVMFFLLGVSGITFISNYPVDANQIQMREVCSHCRHHFYISSQWCQSATTDKRGGFYKCDSSTFKAGRLC